MTHGAARCVRRPIPLRCCRHRCRFHLPPRCRDMLHGPIDSRSNRGIQRGDVHSRALGPCIRQPPIGGCPLQRRIFRDHVQGCSADVIPGVSCETLGGGQGGGEPIRRSQPEPKSMACRRFSTARVCGEHERSCETPGGEQGGGEPITGSWPEPRSMACRRFRAARVCVPNMNVPVKHSAGGRVAGSRSGGLSPSPGPWPVDVSARRGCASRT